MIEVIMLSYNNATTIEKAINSILMQKTDHPFMISIYDNGSTDNSQDVINKLADKNSNIRKIFNEKNIGWARNFIGSIDQAQGDFIAFLDADDHWIDDEKLQKEITCFKQNDCAVVHSSGIIRSDGKDRTLKIRPLTSKELIRVNPIMWQTVMIDAGRKNEVVSALNHFMKKFKKEPIACDYIVLMELSKYGIIGIDDITAVHINNKGSVSHPQKLPRIIKRHYRSALVRLSYNRQFKLGLFSSIMIIVRSIRRFYIQVKETRPKKIQ